MWPRTGTYGGLLRVPHQNPVCTSPRESKARKEREQLLNGSRKRRRYWKLKQENCNTICGELALEEALDPS
jgi:hypothetical protein